MNDGREPTRVARRGTVPENHSTALAPRRIIEAWTHSTNHGIRRQGHCQGGLNQTVVIVDLRLSKRRFGGSEPVAMPPLPAKDPPAFEQLPSGLKFQRTIEAKQIRIAGLVEKAFNPDKKQARQTSLLCFSPPELGRA